MCQMSMNGWMVKRDGSQWKSPSTSTSGFTDELIIT